MKKHFHILFALLLLVGIERATAQNKTSNYTQIEHGKLYTSGMVDLGLSVKWAACNLGAKTPDEYGDYYAWGETETKDSYTEENSLTYGKSISELQSAGITDANGVLTAQYDAVTQNLGSSYRMPTKEEMKELVDSCTWVWGSYNEVNGYYVEGKNGTCIILPASGARGDTDTYYAGFQDYYWSATVRSYYAYYLDFCSIAYKNYDYRYYGLSVRAVCGK